jgi:Fe-S-cluster-containing hydrogenase component 2/CRP-like cAMP-binding protein
MKEIMKARKKDTPVKPPAQLEPRPGDYNLPPALYLACRVFARLKSKPNTDKFPGTLVLRQYQPDEVVCRQNDPGWTAFAILADEDIDALHAEREKLLKDLPAKLQKAVEGNKHEDVEKYREQIAALQSAELPRAEGTTTKQGPPATVYLDTRAEAQPREGLLARLFGRVLPGASEGQRFIAVDAGTTLAYGTRKATLEPGALFGQWSCIYGTPRSATVVAQRHCYVLEMLRNVLDSILGDKQFQEDTDKEYVASVLENHLAGLSIFSGLTAEQLADVRAGVELMRYSDGQIIFDKGGESDCMYIVRRGLVKVLLNEWPLLSIEDVLDWQALASALAGGEGAGPAQRYLANKLTPAAREKLARAASNPQDRPGIVEAINALLADRGLRAVENPRTKKPEVAAELKPLVDAPAFKEALSADFPRDEKDWSDQDWRRYNRILVENACPGSLRSARLPKRRQGDELPAQSRSENILAYLAQGDFFGEMGVMLDQKRSATCVAYVHPRPEADEVDPQGDRWRREEARIELVKIPRSLLLGLCEKHPSIKRKVDEKIVAYQKRSVQREVVRRWEDGEPVQQSDRFQQLGLIQGQKLMLIDLDRCTRCDECVQACVHTHSDGRSRLFLDGPRFGRYLVPATCRSCRDPVCMIGCPVGSIRRGNNLEMVIEDWCIGCQLCAKNCPYGSIQMHDLGILPEESHGWFYRPLARVSGESWTQPEFKARGWLEGSTPFWSDLDLEATLALALKQGMPSGVGGSRAICFRREFTIEGEVLDRAESGFKMVIDATAEEIAVEGTGRQAKLTRFLPVWLNGSQVPLDRWKPAGEQYVFEITGEDRRFLRPGRNTVAIQATPIPGKRAVLLEAAIDEIRTSGAVIPLRAVVCDQCSSLPDQTPACVHACPHDAAMRVDSWTNFPVR